MNTSTGMPTYKRYQTKKQNLSILRTLHNALVLLYFQFSMLNWGFTANKILRPQKRAIRVITNSKHVEPLLKKLNLLKISDILGNSLLKLYYKYKSWNLPHYVMHIFSAEHNVHNHNTRPNTILNHPVTNLFGCEKCVRYHLSLLVEETDSSILGKWTRIAMMGSVYISETYVCKITSLNATSQIVTRAKFYNKIWILYVFSTLLYL